MYDIIAQCCVFRRIPPLRWQKNAETCSSLLYNCILSHVIIVQSLEYIMQNCITGRNVDIIK
jgi:hypothetical protein